MLNSLGSGSEAVHVLCSTGSGPGSTCVLSSPGSGPGGARVLDSTGSGPGQHWVSKALHQHMPRESARNENKGFMLKKKKKGDDFVLDLQTSMG